MTEESTKPSVGERLYILPEKGKEESIEFKKISSGEIPRDIQNVLEVMKESYISDAPSDSLDTFFLFHQNSITTYVGSCTSQSGAAIFVDAIGNERAGRSIIEPDRGVYVPRWTSTEKSYARNGLGTRRLMVMNAYCRQYLDAPLTSGFEIGSFAPDAWKALERAGHVKQIESFDHDGNPRYQFI